MSLPYLSPPMSVQIFLEQLHIHVQHIQLQYQDLMIVGDFNMPPVTPSLCAFLSKNKLQQIIDVPTHILGETLDFIITSRPNLPKTVIPVPYTDHHLVCTASQADF